MKTTDTELQKAQGFCALDAGEMREFLAAELAEWHTDGYWQATRSRTWYRRVKILAARSGIPRATVAADLEADARRIQEGGR